MIKKDVSKLDYEITPYLENKHYHLFGNEDDTVSYVLADNYVRDTLSSFGGYWAKFLDSADKDHLKKSIVNKINSDKLARHRTETKWTESKYQYYLESARNTYS